MQEFGWVLVKAKAGYTWQLFKFCFFKTFIVLSSYTFTSMPTCFVCLKKYFVQNQKPNTNIVQQLKKAKVKSMCNIK